MFLKLFHFLALFGYLNILVYEAGCNTIQNGQSLFDGDSLIEFVLNDVLDIPVKQNNPDSEVMYDDYRIFHSGIYVLPVLFLITAFFFGLLPFIIKKESHPLYRNKSICLPGYYSFLFRYKPF